MLDRLPGVIARHGHGKPVMIFCSTRNASTTTAKKLADMWIASIPSQRLWKGPTTPLTLTSQDLKGR